MSTGVVIVVSVAALAVVAVCGYAILVLSQLARNAKRVWSLLDGEVEPTLRAWREAAQGVQRSAAKLDDGLDALNRSLHRLDRITERLALELLAVAAIPPAIVKVSGWLGVVRKGLAGVKGSRPAVKSTGNTVETEAG